VAAGEDTETLVPDTFRYSLLTLLNGTSGVRKGTAEKYTSLTNVRSRRQGSQVEL
jgi:hypothetical protein